ncbi:MAG: tetratricopeptide repeat protein [Pseudotabrizicola sp.]|nr:tetratricopeptide repeat protein [Pseudotabrizicola sp.]MDO9640140.1 tetratricopeptide repeat protein [Pseudotabrizicola sp.]
MALTLVLAACGTTGGGGLFAARDGGYGVNPNEDSVDGLIVGHRLMAASEYDLALKAYLRAAGEQGFTADVLSALGSANLHLGRLNQSEDLLRKAVVEDPDFVPALNNLGVVLMERGNFGEARLFFQRAFAADSGQTDMIRENLMRAIAKSEDAVYVEPEETSRFTLVRRGYSTYELLSEL